MTLTPSELAELDRFRCLKPGPLGHTHLVKFRVETKTTTPIFSRPYKMNPVAAKATRKMIEGLLAEGVIKETSSPWSSPGFMGFHQIAVEEESQPKLAFMVGNKQYTFLRMAMGPRNAPSCFQRAVDAALGTLLTRCCFVYLDDILVYTPKEKGREGHLRDLHDTLAALDTAGFTTRLDKCKFCLDTLDYLGHKISAGAIRPMFANVEKIMRSKRPWNLASLRRFLGMCGYYRRFIKDYSAIARLLTDLLKGGNRFKWGKEEESAYGGLVQALLDEPVLTSPNWDEEFRLEVDASKEAIGGVLMQKGKVISYGSHRLTEAERQWSATEREIYAGVYFTQKFAYYLSNTTFTLIDETRDPHMRFGRWIGILQQFGDMKIQYRKGSTNYAADYLSRDIEVEFSPIESRIRTLDDLRKAQADDEECLEWCQRGAFPVASGLKRYENIKRDPRTNLIVLHGKAIVPRGFRTRILQDLHESTGHVGINKLFELSRRAYFWPSQKEDCRRFVNECEGCTRTRATQHRAVLRPYESGDLFADMQADICGPLPKTSRGNEYLLVVVDQASRFPWAFPLMETTSAAILEKLGEVFALAGAPCRLGMDQAQYFTSGLTRTVLEMYQTEIIKGPLYRPQARGLVERTIGTVKKRLAATVNGSTEWDLCINPVLAGLRGTKSESLGMSPFEYLTGREMRFPSLVGIAEVPPIQDEARAGDVDRAERIRQVLMRGRQTAEITSRLKSVQNVLRTRSTPVPEFQVGQLVLYSKGLKPRRKSAIASLFLGPLEVVKRYGPYIYKVKGGGESFIAHVDNLKLYTGKKRVAQDAEGEKERKRRRDMVRRTEEDPEIPRYEWLSRKKKTREDRTKKTDPESLGRAEKHAEEEMS
ncbi:hypothetical protein FOL47_010031 [Perkinsus chesapeaki]|uniref:Integrase catalytic domain-containing protein n=1 Tax=Perkinsus chesapeaki TaxID=330153 RepID=A0A7J6L578_PERCH|nr:hypothetical protein FOL47_010031 [Perkinsus chesapeaki]